MKTVPDSFRTDEWPKSAGEAVARPADRALRRDGASPRREPRLPYGRRTRPKEGAAEPTNAQAQGSSSGGPKSVMLNGDQNAGSCGAIALAFVISMKNGSKRLAGTATNVTRPGPSPT